MSAVEYKIFCEYLQGKTIKELIGEDGKFKINDEELKK